MFTSLSSNGATSERSATIASRASSQRWHPGLPYSVMIVMRPSRHGVPAQVLGIRGGLEEAGGAGDHRRVVCAELRRHELEAQAALPTALAAGPPGPAGPGGRAPRPRASPAAS